MTAQLAIRIPRRGTGQQQVYRSILRSPCVTTREREREQNSNIRTFSRHVVEQRSARSTLRMLHDLLPLSSRSLISINVQPSVAAAARTITDTRNNSNKDILNITGTDRSLLPLGLNSPGGWFNRFDGSINPMA